MPDKHDRADDLDLDVDVEKRGTLRRMIASAAFAAPVVASFPISGMMIERALAFDPHLHEIVPLFSGRGTIIGQQIRLRRPFPTTPRVD